MSWRGPTQGAFCRQIMFRHCVLTRAEVRCRQSADDYRHIFVVKTIIDVAKVPICTGIVVGRGLCLAMLGGGQRQGLVCNKVCVFFGISAAVDNRPSLQRERVVPAG